MYKLASLFLIPFFLSSEYVFNGNRIITVDNASQQDICVICNYVLYDWSTRIVHRHTCPAGEQVYIHMILYNNQGMRIRLVSVEIRDSFQQKQVYDNLLKVSDIVFS
jgi:hypothetical protein